MSITANDNQRTPEEVAREQRFGEVYRWQTSVAQDAAEPVTRLTELNRQVSLGERAYSPFSS